MTTTETGSIGDDVVAALRNRIRGAVLTGPECANGDLRHVFNAMHAGVPGVAVRCTGVDDVVAAVNCARENGLTLAVRGGGHSIAGLSAIEGGMLLDLSPMNGVEVDAAAGRATVGGGALWGDVDTATQEHGLVVPGGVVSETGVAGLTLGGGYGWVRRKHGLSVDSLVAAEIVCADGEVRTASADENEDLFWAIRGGGGNFGVVTSFTFEAHRLGPEVAFSATFYAIEEMDQVLRGWRDFVEGAPNEITTAVVTMTFPANPEMPDAVHDRPVAIVGAVHTGDVEEGLEATKPLRGLGTPLFDMSGPTPYIGVQTGFDPLFPRNTLRAYWKSAFVDDLTDEAIATIASLAQDRPAPMTLVNTFAMGGAIAEVDAEATAFATRSANYLVSLDGMWGDAADDERVIGWIRSAFDQVNEHGTGDVYLNFTGRSDEAPSAGLDSQFGRNLARLAEVKAKYDPDNLFRVNNNIAPAG